MPAPTPKPRFTHFALFVKDIDRMEKFYTDVVGLTASDRGPHPNAPVDMVFMSSDPKEHHQFVLVSGRPENIEFHLNQQMSFPTTMELRTTPDGIKLFRWPIKEIESLYTKKHEFTNRPIEALASTLGGIKAELIDASIEFDPKETGNIEWTLRGLKVVYQADKQQFIYKDTALPAPPVNGKVKLRVLVDRGSIELFANEGAAVATHYALPDPENRSITLSGNGNVSLMINELKSSWPQE